MGRPKKKQVKLCVDGEKLREFYKNPPYPPKKINREELLDSFKKYVRTKEFKRFSQQQQELTSKFGGHDNMIMMVHLNAMGYCGSFGGAVYVERNEFDCNLTDAQIEILTNLFNSQILMCQTASVREIKNLFYNPYHIGKPLQVKSNRLLIYLFVNLCRNNFIASDWQNIIDKYNLFLSPKGKHITRKDISRAKATFMGGETPLNPYPKGYEDVDKAIQMISHKAP